MFHFNKFHSYKLSFYPHNLQILCVLVNSKTFKILQRDQYLKIQFIRYKFSVFEQKNKLKPQNKCLSRSHMIHICHITFVLLFWFKSTQSNHRINSYYNKFKRGPTLKKAFILNYLKKISSEKKKIEPCKPITRQSCRESGRSVCNFKGQN